MRKFNDKHTLAASYIGYICQAIVNNLAPLLFLTFQKQFDLGLAQLASLITVNFGTQLLVDAASTLFVDKIGYRKTAVLAHLFCFAGLIGLGVLPNCMPSPYVGILLAIIFSAIGGGLIEVVISPIVQAIPNDTESAAMNLLHSFYCWGVVLVVALSTVYFAVFGLGAWPWLCLLWAVVPLANSMLFMVSPVRHLLEDGEKALTVRKLFSKPLFLLLMALMICSGASELAMSQWSSFFAETALSVSKTMGDLLGPCSFAVLMGLARLILGLGKIKWRMEKILLFSSILCVFSYLLTVFSPFPLLSLLGCALCGLSVGAMWPGTFSLAARIFPKGATNMFAILALAGDIGCAFGPSLVGLVSERSGQGELLLFGQASPLKIGLLAAIVFPLLLGLLVFFLGRARKLQRSAEK